MNWQDNITRWRNLPPEERLRRNWEAIPDDVAESMAFEGEPVDIEIIRRMHASITPPWLRSAGTDSRWQREPGVALCGHENGGPDHSTS